MAQFRGIDLQLQRRPELRVLWKVKAGRHDTGDDMGRSVQNYTPPDHGGVAREETFPQVITNDSKVAGARFVLSLGKATAQISIHAEHAEEIRAYRNACQAFGLPMARQIHASGEHIVRRHRSKHVVVGAPEVEFQWCDGRRVPDQGGHGESELQ